MVFCCSLEDSGVTGCPLPIRRLPENQPKVSSLLVTGQSLLTFPDFPLLSQLCAVHNIPDNLWWGLNETK